MLISMLVLSLFSIGFASVYLPPVWFWWTGLPASLLPFLALAAVGLLLVHALLGHGRWAGLHLAVVVLFLIRAGWPAALYADLQTQARATQADAATVPRADTLTVMSFNYTPQEGGPAHAPVLRNALGHLASTYRPELIAMQSVRVFQRRGRVAFINELDTLAAAGYRVKPDAGFAPLDTRVPLFSRLPVPMRQQPVVLKAQQRTDRHVTRTELSWQGQDIVVYNAHLRSFERGYALELLEAGRYRDALRELVAVYRRDVLRRVQEVRELRRLVARETQPTLLLGDLNASPFNWEYHHMRGEMRDAAAQLGGNWRFTWHTRLPLARIDHVLTSAHWQPVAMHVDPTHVSDHFPLIVQLQIQPDA